MVIVDHYHAVTPDTGASPRTPVSGDVDGLDCEIETFADCNFTRAVDRSQNITKGIIFKRVAFVDEPIEYSLTGEAGVDTVIDMAKWPLSSRSLDGLVVTLSYYRKFLGKPVSPRR